MDNKTKKERTTKANIMKRCFICSQKFERQNLDTHMHSYEHHKAIEQIKGSEQVHKCWACDVSVMGLHQYEEHIATEEHKLNLPELQQKRHQKKRIPVDYNIELNNAEINTLRMQKQKEREERGLQICFVCCYDFLLKDLDTHMHSLVHHQAIEKLKGSEQVHECLACDVSVTGLQRYKKHVHSSYHKKMMAILNERTDDEKITLDYSVQFDDELKALCAQRDQQITNKKNKQRLLKRKEAKKAETRQNAQQKLIQNCQMNNESQSVHITTPALPGVDFTSDDLPSSCCFSSCEEQQNLPTFRPNQKVPKRRQEGIFDMDNSNCPVVKRPCLSSERPAPEMSAQVLCPTPDGKVTGVCANELTSKNELVAFAESTSATEPVQRDDNHITIMLGTIRKSLDHRGVAIGSEVSVESCTKKVVGQTCKSNYDEEQDERPKKSKNKHMKKKERPVKGKTSKQSMRIHSPEKSGQDPCSEDVTPALRSNTQNQMNAKVNNILLLEQDMPGENINGREASVASLSSVTSLVEKIGILDSQTSANCNENECQILEFCGNLLPKKNVIPEGHNHFQTISCNLQKPKSKKQDISNITRQNPETNATFKQKNVKKLMTLSLREESLTSSLENVGDQLFQAYSTLQNAYTEVQHLLELKQQVTSEMATLREKRFQILQELQNPSQTHNTSEHLT